jgi:hypothetical protein
MSRFLGKKTTMACVTVAVAVAMSAAVAVAIPVLQPGQTSAPGMSGNCAGCHTYAVAAAPKVVANRVSHPYMAKKKVKLGRTFKVWGFFPPKLSGAADTTLTIGVQRLDTHKKWIAVPSLTTTGTVTATGKFKKMTNYGAKLTIKRAGNYQMRAKLIYKNADGIEATKWSPVTKFKVVK